MRIVQLLTSFLIMAICIVCTKENEDWDFCSEGSVEMQICDLSPIEVGIYPKIDATVDLVRIEISLAHAEPSNLEIKLIYNNDTLVIWDNDYPGGTQVSETDYFAGKSVNAYWGLSIYDEVPDGNEGMLRQFTLKIKYQ